MGEINKTVDIIKNKKDEFDKKRMHDKEARLIYDGLRFAYIEIVDLQSKIDKIILENQNR